MTKRRRTSARASQNVAIPGAKLRAPDTSVAMRKSSRQRPGLPGKAACIVCNWYLPSPEIGGRDALAQQGCRSHVLGKSGPGVLPTFSQRIRAPGKSIVFSATTAAGCS